MADFQIGQILQNVRNLAEMALNIDFVAALTQYLNIKEGIVLDLTEISFLVIGFHVLLMEIILNGQSLAIVQNPVEMEPNTEREIALIQFLFTVVETVRG